MTPFSLLCAACGLSAKEAAEFLRVRPDTALSWSSGRRTPSDDVLKELATLHRLIHLTAEQFIETMRDLVRNAPDDAKPTVIFLGYCADDAEAQALGLPFASCHAIMLSHVIADAIRSGQQVRLAPRGATPATAAAADARDR